MYLNLILYKKKLNNITPEHCAFNNLWVVKLKISTKISTN